MLQKSSFEFLKNLALNNHKEWMDAHRKEYETAKEDFKIVVSAIINGLQEIGMDTTALTASNCIFRMNRDIRFAIDKSPYKTNFGAAFSPHGRKAQEPGYYLHVEPGKSFVGGGMWMPDAAQLKKIRQEIDYNFADFQIIISDKKFKSLFHQIEGPKLIRAPKNYAADHPALEYLKLKSYTVGVALTDAQLCKKDAVEKVLEVFRTMKPFIDFLNTALDE